MQMLHALRENTIDDPSRRLSAEAVDRGEIDASAAADMFALFARYYCDVSRERFQCDLAGKDRVILLTDLSSALRGFSTLAVSEHEIDGQRLRIVFSGDTIIDRECWGSPVFSTAWVREIGRIRAQRSEVPLYWLLIVKGHRTFRYLPTFAFDFVPNWSGGDRKELLYLRDRIASDMFGRAYDPASGLLRFDDPRGRLADEWADISLRERARPDVAFFLESNPHFTRGDELVCLCELSEVNMRPLTLRLFRQGFDAWTAGKR